MEILVKANAVQTAVIEQPSVQVSGVTGQCYVRAGSGREKTRVTVGQVLTGENGKNVGRVSFSNTSSTDVTVTLSENTNTSNTSVTPTQTLDFVGGDLTVGPGETHEFLPSVSAVSHGGTFVYRPQLGKRVKIRFQNLSSGGTAQTIRLQTWDEFTAAYYDCESIAAGEKTIVFETSANVRIYNPGGVNSCTYYFQTFSERQ